VLVGLGTPGQDGLGIGRKTPTPTAKTPRKGRLLFSKLAPAALPNVASDEQRGGALASGLDNVRGSSTTEDACLVASPAEGSDGIRPRVLDPPQNRWRRRGEPSELFLKVQPVRGVLQKKSPPIPRRTPTPSQAHRGEARRADLSVAAAPSTGRALGVCRSAAPAKKKKRKTAGVTIGPTMGADALHENEESILAADSAQRTHRLGESRQDHSSGNRIEGCRPGSISAEDPIIERIEDRLSTAP